MVRTAASANGDGPYAAAAWDSWWRANRIGAEVSSSRSISDRTQSRDVSQVGTASTKRRNPRGETSMKPVNRRSNFSNGFSYQAIASRSSASMPASARQ